MRSCLLLLSSTVLIAGESPCWIVDVWIDDVAFGLNTVPLICRDELLLLQLLRIHTQMCRLGTEVFIELRVIRILSFDALTHRIGWRTKSMKKVSMPRLLDRRLLTLCPCRRSVHGPRAVRTADRPFISHNRLNRSEQNSPPFIHFSAAIVRFVSADSHAGATLHVNRLFVSIVVGIDEHDNCRFLTRAAHEGAHST